MKIVKLTGYILVAAIIVSTVSGCSKNQKKNSEKPAAVESKTTLTLWDYFEGVNSQRGITALVTAFNASQDDIVINAVFTPRDEMDKQLSIGLVSNKLPDIVLIDGCDYASRISMGLFADINLQRISDLPSMIFIRGHY